MIFGARNLTCPALFPKALQLRPAARENIGEDRRGVDDCDAVTHRREFDALEATSHMKLAAMELFAALLKALTDQRETIPPHDEQLLQLRNSSKYISHISKHVFVGISASERRKPIEISTQGPCVLVPSCIKHTQN